MAAGGFMTNSIAVVTGAGSGIGREVALHFARKQLHVFAVGRNRDKLHKTVALANAGESIVPICADITHPDSLRLALSDIGRVDILVVNAGICERANMSDSDAADVWQKVIATNLTGSWHTLHGVCDRLAEGARVVMVSSGLGKTGRAGYTAYAASKHGMLGIMRCLSLEWAPRKITVNAVCPGWVNTEMALADLNTTASLQGTSVHLENKKATENIPMGRFVTSHEVASLIGWLCSDDSRMITGQAYNISGGEIGL
jgi:NAD(P)-dependent dehydrogenase (short-subunit alcohol dehydrogenase family)